MASKSFNPQRIIEEIKEIYCSEVQLLRGKAKNEHLVGVASRCGSPLLAVYEETVLEICSKNGVTDIVILRRMEGTAQEVEASCESCNPQILFADNFEEAIIGVARVAGEKEWIAAYDQEKIIGVLMENDEMDEESAWEHFFFNISGAYVGPTTPIFLDIMREDF
jgi:hypothetical protein